MSTLPTHRKSPEELARLRDALGVPGPTPDPPAPASEPEPPPPARPGPIPHLDPPSPPKSGPHEPKPVRSLKRSEREPAPAPHRPATASGPLSKLPDHRHSPEEIADIRRRSAIAAIQESTFELPRSASKPLLALAYFLAIGGAASPTLLRGLAKLTESLRLGLVMSEGYHLLLAGTIAALPLAAFIALKRTQSRHHAAILAAISVFAILFSLLHFFPALTYGT
jgi:hypothetical protein